MQGSKKGLDRFICQWVSGGISIWLKRWNYGRLNHEKTDDINGDISCTADRTRRLFRSEEECQGYEYSGADGEWNLR